MPRRDLVQREVEAAFYEVVQTYPDVFIAGGYLRDRTVEIAPMDVDFFTFMPLAKGRESMLAPGGGASDSLGEKRVVAVEIGPGINMYSHILPSQIIHIDQEWSTTPVGTIRQFLFGATQSFWTPDKYGVTEEFLQDIEAKRFTVCRCMHTYDVEAVCNKWLGSKTYSGLKDRFPDWVLAIPRKWQEAFDFDESSERVIFV